jgi:glycosyltransferase involved in cell wall biosynthesis
VRGRTDVEATLLGFGDCLEDLERQCTSMDLDPFVTFTGRAGPPMIAEHLSRAAVGLCPDLATPLNDVSTMNKTMEYMAYALPSVSFDLVETRVSGADTCLYVPSADVQAFTDAVERLLDDPELRLTMARNARERAARVLDWKPQAEAYVSVFDRLVPPVEVPAGAERGDEPVPVDLDDEQEFRAFVLGRGPVRDHALGA